LLLKAGEPEGFGSTVELMMLASAAAVVAGLFIGSQSADGGADSSSRVGTWSGALVLELLSVVPILCAVPSLFHELIHSSLVHGKAAAEHVQDQLGASELLPAIAVLPFLLYQLAGFGTLRYLVSKPVNWAINLGICGLIVASYVAGRMDADHVEDVCISALVIGMVITVFYGVLELRRLQTAYDAHCPPKAPK